MPFEIERKFIVTNDRLAMVNPNAPARAWTSGDGDTALELDRTVEE